MEIRRRGKQPHNAFAMVPNETIRTALTQLETSGYIRRWRERQADGTYKAMCDVYPYGDAAGGGTDEDIDDDEESPAPENPSPVEPGPENPAPDSQAPYRTPSTEDSPDSPVAAAAPSDVVVAGSPLNLTSNNAMPNGLVPNALPSNLPSPMEPRSFPLAEQDTLQAWFSITDGTSWVTAWNAAVASPTTVEYDPQVHLAEYLIKCRDTRQKPRPDIWLKWFIEDRQQYAQKLVANAQQVLNSGISGQEREERDNRRMPPANWGVPSITTEGNGS